jgi:hypothetical protein
MSTMKEDRTSHRVRRVVSGGQTGVDRSALDAAIEQGIDHGGWCPRGRLAEDGTIPALYRLVETESTEYPVRTERNVVDSDGTLILFRERLVGGTELTRRLAAKHGRPCYLADLARTTDLRRVRSWLADHDIRVLNVAGPRESSSPGIGQVALRFLRDLLSGVE